MIRAVAAPLAPKPPPADRRRVYVITREKRMFGVHCPRKPLPWTKPPPEADQAKTPDDRPADDRPYQSHVFGFLDLRHARLMALTLEGHYLRHGRFPASDMASPRTTSDFSRLHADDAVRVPGLRHVAVEEIALSDLLWRLRGTGVVVTLLSKAERDDGSARGGSGDGDDPTRKLKCTTVRPDCTAPAVRDALARAWAAAEAAETAAAAPVDTMELKPRPVWPPLLPVGRRRMRWLRGESAVDLLRFLLASSLFKVLVVLEVLGVTRFPLIF